MAVNDPIADMLTRIRNANLARHPTTRVPSTQLTRNIAKVLQSEGFITGYEEAEDGIQKFLVVSLRYVGKNRKPTIKMLKRVSRPGLRVYANRKELPRGLGGIGVAIISTSSGIMTDREARKQGVGGEVLCYVW